jgi:hypothetical protein
MMFGAGVARLFPHPERRPLPQPRFLKGKLRADREALIRYMLHGDEGEIGHARPQ